VTRPLDIAGRATLALIVLLSGCKKQHGVGSLGGASPSGNALAEPEASARPPLDHLASGELPPGTATAHGLVLPRGMRLFANFSRTAEAIGPQRPEDVANYIRERVTTTRIELGAVGTVFPAVHVKDGDPMKTLRIEVVPLGDRTKVVVRDITPPREHVAIDPNETDEMRWRKAGYNNKDRTLIDKNELK
jgi:hypothetical protein